MASGELQTSHKEGPMPPFEAVKGQIEHMSDAEYELRLMIAIARPLTEAMAAEREQAAQLGDN